MIRNLFVVATMATAAVGLAAPANADSYLAQQHRVWAVNNFGPAFCARLDAEPTALNVYNFTRGLVGMKLTDGWYFFEDEAEQITATSISTYCPQHQGLYYGTKFGEGFVQGLLGG
jgi:hypothetical protein